jgi:hypothetical protein
MWNRKSNEQWNAIITNKNTFLMLDERLSVQVVMPLPKIGKTINEMLQNSTQAYD